MKRSEATMITVICCTITAVIVGLAMLIIYAQSDAISKSEYNELNEHYKAAIESYNAKNNAYLKLLRQYEQLEKEKEVVVAKNATIQKQLEAAMMDKAESNLQAAEESGIHYVTARRDDGRCPQCCENWYPCEPATAITNKRSDQCKLQMMSRTDNHGLRRFHNYITVAIGTSAECEIGDTWHIALANGKEYDVMCGDWTAPAADASIKPPDGERYPADCDSKALEFIVSWEWLDSRIKTAGTVGALEEFGGQTAAGNIISWEYTGKQWPLTKR